MMTRWHRKAEVLEGEQFTAATKIAPDESLPEVPEGVHWWTDPNSGYRHAMLNGGWLFTGDWIVNVPGDGYRVRGDTYLRNHYDRED
jgi:hypothetical protein